MPDVQQDQQGYAIDNLPYRDGEKERYGSVLELEHARREESRTQNQKLIPPQFRDTPQGEMIKWSRSPSAKKRQRLMLTKEQELQEQTQKVGGRIVGPLAPATVLNFNPIALRLSGMLYYKMVPQAGYSDQVFIRLTHRGRRYTGHYVTFDSAHLWTAQTGVSTDTTLGLDTPSMEAQYIPPRGIAHQFYEHYVEGAQDAQHMGGILVFEGDKHTFGAALNAGDEAVIFKPVARPLMDGQGGIVYRSEEISLWDELERCFDMQKDYCDARMTEAHAWHATNNVLQQNMISGEHREWARWGVDMGYYEKLPLWANPRLSRAKLVEAVVCKDCGQEKPEGNFYLCQACGRPYDIFQAFMNGANVAPQYLELLEGAEFDQVAQILGERRKKRERLEGSGLNKEPRAPVKPGDKKD